MKLRTVLLSAAAAVFTAALAAQAQVPGINSALNAVFTLANENATMKPTYSTWNTFAITTGSPTDVCMLSGSSTRQVRVRRVFLSMVATTAVTEPIAVVKRSTLSQGASGSTTVVGVPYDSTSAASAVAIADIYFSNPTVGTLVGVLADPLFSVGNLTTGGAQTLGSGIIWGQLGQSIVLRSATEMVAINFNGIAYSGNIISCGFEWTEE